MIYIYNRVCCKLQGVQGFPVWSLKIRTLVHKRLKIGPQFLPTLHKFCILLRCQTSQTEISKRNSTKLCQTVDALTICRRKVGVVLPKKLGPRKLLHLFSFSMTSILNSECLLNETCHRQPGNDAGKHEESPTWCQNFMNFCAQTA